VIDLGDGRALVHTVDFFPPILDDPYDFGRVAAANALSDVYAMGGVPISALNVVGFPLKTLGIDVLAEILAGGAAVVGEAGAALLGGHSVKDTEVKYGLAVTGLVSIAHLTTNRRAKPGDRLILTKPLGMGAISTAIKRQTATAESIDAAVAIMATLNAGAAVVMRTMPVHAATDITGFGLIGHAAELARAADVSIRFDAATLPLAPGVLALVAEGHTSGAMRRNRESLGAAVSIDAGVPAGYADVAFDAETSGGLLLAVPPDAAGDVVDALREQRTPCAVVIGEVTPRAGALVSLR
jgi:selenide, water dikinase